MRKNEVITLELRSIHISVGGPEGTHGLGGIIREFEAFGGEVLDTTHRKLNFRPLLVGLSYLGA
jgi:hypothetical protein